MFRCDHCQTEYGGIRGIVAARCPRCAAADAPAISVRRGDASAVPGPETIGVTRSGAIVAISRQGSFASGC